LRTPCRGHEAIPGEKMILIDTDIFVIDRRYVRDVKFQINSKFLDYLSTKGIDRATTIFNLYEVCGIMSFNLSKQQVQNLFIGFESIYGLKIIYPPLGNKTPEEAFDRLLADTLRLILEKMAFLDALIISTAESVPHVESLITWNAKHFLNKTKLTVQTPENYLIAKEVPI